jgi:hypothetical protein
MSTEATPAPVALQNPWPGLVAYTEQQSDLFFGREAEIKELLRLIQRETLTVLFGRSGLGKSSLLNAGVIPRLRAGMYFPVLLKLNFADSEVDPVAYVKATTLEDARKNGLETDSRIGKNPAATLWEFFHGTDFWGPRNDRLTPLLIFDQFEEAFTIGKDQSQATDLLQQLADLVENRIPAVVGKRIKESADLVNIDLGSPNYKVVLSLREDFVSCLDQLRETMPSVMHNRMGLLPLDGARALKVIVNSGKSWVSEAVAQDIVAALAGETGAAVSAIAQAEIEPAYLSVMCHELFLRMVDLGQPGITSELVARERGEIIETMYERSFEGLAEPVRLFVEDRLLSASGFRLTIPLSEALAEGLSLDDLETLVRRRLLCFEDRLGTRHVELSHDLLTGVVKKSRELRSARVAREEEERKREELRRSFRTKAITGIAIGAVVFAVLGTLTIWALFEGNKARTAEKNILASNSALKQEDIQLQNQARELKVQRDKAEMEEQEANKSKQATQALQQETLKESSAIMSASDAAISATYEDALKVFDTYRSTTDQNAKAELNLSIWAHRNNLQNELKSVDAILMVESNDASAKSLKLSLLFYIADLESRAYGFDEDKYGAFLAYAQPMLNEKDPWLQAKALRAIAQAAAIVHLKPDEVAVKNLLDEVRLKGGEMQSRNAHGGLNAKTWDALEDAYEEGAELEKDRDPKDAGTWFTLAMQTEMRAAQLDSQHLGDVARIAAMFGDFEKDQKDYDAAIREYSVAIQYTQEMLRTQNGGKPNLSLVTDLINRGDAEVSANNYDAARKDFEDATANNDKLGDSADISYKKLVIADRLGSLEETSKNPSKALEWYRKERQIALDLAQADATRRSSVVYSYSRISSIELELGDAKAARSELKEEVSTWEKWKSSMQQSDLQEYVKSLIALGTFDYAQKDYKTALQSYDEANTWALLTTVRWTTPDNEILLVQSKANLAQAYEGLKDFDKALASAEDGKDMARELVEGDCNENNLNQLNSVESLGIIHLLVALKRADEAQAEARDVLQFVEKSCKSIGRDSSRDARTALAQFWGNLSWETIRAGDARTGETSAEKGFELDPDQTWIEVNLAHSYLLSGRIEDARRLYSAIKDKPWGDHLLNQDIRNDFAELRSLGLGRPEMDSILNSLGDKTN